MKIAHIAPLTYSPGKLEYFQFIRGGIGADFHQGPAFYYFPDGSLMLRWMAYDFQECSPNGVLLHSLSRDQGITWSDPQIFMADQPGGVPCFVNIVPLRGTDTVLMLHARMRHKIEVDEARRMVVKHSNYFESSTRIFLRRSGDGGRSFDHGKEIPYQLISGGKELPGTGFYGAIDDFIQLASGRILAAFMFMDPARIKTERQDWASQHYTGACLFSDNGGADWQRSSEISVDTQRGVMETQIVETEPNRLFALFRTKGGYLYQTRSDDGGETWSSSTPSSLPAPESICRMIKLRGGNLLVVWNCVSSTTQQPRHPLAAATSADGGNTWSKPKVIADEIGANQLSNHGLIQLNDGRILLGISHYRAVKPMSSDLDIAIFDEAWLAKIV